MQPSLRSDPLLGSVLLGTYRVDRLLGRGGMGSVYAATHVHLQTPCAVKVLLREFTDEGEPLKRFQREAQITSHLGHPNIVRVTDFNFTPDGAPFMVMELLDGETLHRRLRAHGQLTLPEIVRLFGPLCDALGLAHEKGVIHRDLKPENIFLPQDLGLDGAKILDFGISKIRDGNTRLTKADMTMGTQSYMAPELVMGAAAEADTRSDVFSLGAILYEVLTAKLAYDGPNGMAVMYKLVYQDAPSARAFDPAIPEAVDAVVQRALARSPEERIPSAPQLFQELLSAAMPYLPPAEDLEAQISTPYRYTTSAMRAVRQSTSLPTVPGTGPLLTVPERPPTGPQAARAAGRTGPEVIVSGQPTGSHGTLTGPQLQLRPAARLTRGPSDQGPGGPPGQRPAPALGDPAELAADHSLPDALEEHAQQRRRGGGGPVMAIIAALVVVTAGGLFVVRQRMTQGEPAAAAPPPAPPPAPAPTSPPATVAAPEPAPAPLAEGKGPDRATVADEPAEEAAGKGKRRHRSRHGKGRELPRVRLPSVEE